MESGYNGTQESKNQLFSYVENKVFLGNQKASENKDLLIKNKISHILLVGNELEAVFQEVKIHQKKIIS